MDKFKIFQRDLSPGDSVELFLISGKTVIGQVLSIEEMYVQICNGGQKATFFYNLIGGWQKISEYINNNEGNKKTCETAPGSNELIRITADSKDEKPLKEESICTVINSKKNLDVSFAFEVFERRPLIEFPEPNFKLKDIPQDDQSELIWAKNKYDYALKVKEIARLNDIVPRLARAGERLGSVEIYFICGSLSVKIGNFIKAKDYLNYCAGHNSRRMAIALAALNALDEKWNNCVNFLIHSLIADNDYEIDLRLIIEWIGQSLSQLEDREVSGLIKIIDYLNETDKAFALRVIAFSVSKKYPEQCLDIINNNWFESKKIMDGSKIFEDFKLPIPSKYFINNGDSAKQIDERKENLIGTILAVYPKGNRFFGFIKEESFNEVFYFDTSTIIDSAIYDSIDSCFPGLTVHFKPTSSIFPGKKYRQAKNVCRFGANIKEEESLLKRKKQFATIEKLEGDYGRAKRAELVGNLEESEQLFQKVINNPGKYRSSAIMDYAMLCHRIGQSPKSLNVLDEYGKYVENKLAVENQKITILISIKNFSRAIKIINELISSNISTQRTNNLKRQLVYCYYNFGDYEKALKTLNTLPKDSAIQNLISRIKSAKEGKHQECSIQPEIIEKDFVQWTSGISLFCDFLIDRCDYSELDEKAQARGHREENDFKQLEYLRDKIGARRPEKFGKILLTLAKLCREEPELAGDRDEISYLSRALTFLGEAALHQYPNNPDISRSYLVEALILTPIDKIVPPLSYLLATYLSICPSPGSLLREKDKRIYFEDVLERLQERELLHFKDHFTYYSTVSNSIIDFIRKNKKSYKKLYDIICVTGEDNLKDNIFQCNDHILSMYDTITSLENLDYNSSSSCSDAAKILNDLSEKAIFLTDRSRMKQLATLCIDVSRYLNNTDYLEKESMFLQANQGLRRIIKQCEDEPTKISIEKVIPLVTLINKTIEHNFDIYVQNCPVSLNISNVLENDYYIVKEDGSLIVKIAIFSPKGNAPIENIEIIIEKQNGIEGVESGISFEPLRASESREIELHIKVSSKHIQEKAFTLACLFSYRKRKGDSYSEKFTLPIRLGTPSDFIEILNPFSNYAGGRSVDDPTMFKGRKSLIDHIFKVLTSKDKGQCFVLYGQKRSGKTSVLRQLRKKLHKPFLPVEITIGLLDTADGGTHNFHKLCIDRLEESLQDSFTNVNLEWWPKESEIRQNPSETFRKTLRNTMKFIVSSGWSDPNIIFLIDEFTYLYEYIAEELLPRTFMRQWKAMLQMELFNAVIVGQDSMPKFKRDFPNEFGVTHDERLTYLDLDEAKSLIDEPIRINNNSRYRGSAIEKIIYYTAGSPFYTQIFCDQLVRHMNRIKAPFITEADIENIAVKLTSGDTAIPQERFDPLITAAGESVAEAYRHTYLNLLKNIALHTRGKSGAHPNELPQIENKENILKDMQDRDVIRIEPQGRIKIKVGIFEKWLKAHVSLLEGGGDK